jgi:hypothetical protein
MWLVFGRDNDEMIFVEDAGHGSLTFVRAPGHHWPGRLSSDDSLEGANHIEIVGASLAFSADLRIRPVSASASAQSSSPSALLSVD